MGTMPPKGTVHRVEQSMNNQGAMVLGAADGRDTVHAVEYATPRIRDRLASLSPGDTVRLRVTRVGLRANVWRVEQTYPGTETGHVAGWRATPDDADADTDADIPVTPPDTV